MFVLSFTIMTGCGSGDSSDKPTKKVVIHGVAAKGALLPAGAAVEVRGSAVDGTPSDILTTTIATDGTYSIDVSALASPYLIRVYDTVGSVWYYSETDDTIAQANVNPLTDAVIRTYFDSISLNSIPTNDGGYLQPSYTLIDDAWPLGVYLNTNVNVTFPSMDNVNKISHTLCASLTMMYNLPTNLGSIITANWTVGSGFDALLDNFGIDSNNKWKAQVILDNAVIDANYIDSYYLYTTVSDGVYTIHYTIYTTASSAVDKMTSFNIPLVSTDDNGINCFQGSETTQFNSYVAFNGYVPQSTSVRIGDKNLMSSMLGMTLIIINK